MKNKSAKKDNNKQYTNESRLCNDKTCRAVNSDNINPKDIQKYTKEAESLVQALSALTKLAEQLKPCLAAKSKSLCSCAPSKNSNQSDTPSDTNSDEPAAEETISKSKAGQMLQEAKPVPKVRLPDDKVIEPDSSDDEDTETDSTDRIKSYNVSATNSDTICSCGSKTQGALLATKPPPKKEKPRREKPQKVKKEKEPKQPSPRPAEPTENITTFPTVSAISQKAAMNLTDTSTQTDPPASKITTESNTVRKVVTDDGVQHVRGQGQCVACCQVSCSNLAKKPDTQEVGTVGGPSTTLNAIPLEEYAEVEYGYQYLYDDADGPKTAVLCMCASTDNLPEPTTSHPNQPPTDGYEQPHQKQTYHEVQQMPPQTMMYPQVPPPGLPGVKYPPPDESIVYRACMSPIYAENGQTITRKGEGIIDCTPNCHFVNSVSSQNRQPNYRRVQYQDDDEYFEERPQPVQHYKPPPPQKVAPPCQYYTRCPVRQSPGTSNTKSNNCITPCTANCQKGGTRAMNNMFGKDFNIFSVSLPYKNAERPKKNAVKTAPASNSQCNGPCKK